MFIAFNSLRFITISMLNCKTEGDYRFSSRRPGRADHTIDDSQPSRRSFALESIRHSFRARYTRFELRRTFRLIGLGNNQSRSDSGECGPSVGCSGRWLSIGSSRLVLRVRSMSRQTRDTTVVSHPPRFSVPLVSDRDSFNQDSCTASSASMLEPRIR
jgi:hypothetical protein